VIHQNYEFTRKDVEELAERLASAQLSDRERSLLLAIFLAARDHVVALPAKDPDAALTSATLQDQLIKAFIPGEKDGEANLILQPMNAQLIRPVPITPPPPPPRPPSDPSKEP
jgi:hypothetical protein